MSAETTTETRRHSTGSAPAADRLRDALAEMIRQQASETSPKGLTATTLCQLADVSRNALYRYHPDVLLALQRAQLRHGGQQAPARREVAQVRGENDALREQVTKLAALVDHYYAAWKESSTLLARRERELSELRRNIKPRLMPIKK
ncbi:MAG TPA: hypothetical protein VIM34_24070 [Burkholderiaceae bacterium]